MATGRLGTAAVIWTLPAASLVHNAEEVLFSRSLFPLPQELMDKTPDGARADPDAELPGRARVRGCIWEARRHAVAIFWSDPGAMATPQG